MSALRKITPTLTQLERANPHETLFDAYHEYKDAFGLNHIVGAAVEVTRHRHESKRKHITFDQAESIVEFSLYGEDDKGHSVYNCLTRMVDVSYTARQRARDPEQFKHFDLKHQLLKKMVGCLELIWQD